MHNSDKIDSYIYIYIKKILYEDVFEKLFS